jgi:hypothetical protein
MAISRGTKRIARKILPRRVVDRLRPALPFDNTYPWLNRAFAQVVRRPACRLRPQYAWGVVQGAALARVLGLARVSVVEFGVAGGHGLLALECAAGAVETLTGVGVDVFGFDTGEGLPRPADYRDQPNMWFEGQLPMDHGRLLAALSRASLRIGRVADTVPRFLAGGPAPVAFVSFDLDLYSSTRDALALFEAEHRLLLPRVLSYFDDIFGYSYNDYCGERLAIREFNQRNDARKISPVRGLRYFLPRSTFHDLWPDGMHFAHLFEHPLYGVLDSVTKPMYMDVEGNFVEAAPGPAERRQGERRGRDVDGGRAARLERRTWQRRSAR